MLPSVSVPERGRFECSSWIFYAFANGDFQWKFIKYSLWEICCSLFHISFLDLISIRVSFTIVATYTVQPRYIYISMSYIISSSFSRTANRSFNVRNNKWNALIHARACIVVTRPLYTHGTYNTHHTVRFSFRPISVDHIRSRKIFPTHQTEGIFNELVRYYTNVTASERASECWCALCACTMYMCKCNPSKWLYRLYAVLCSRSFKCFRLRII